MVATPSHVTHISPHPKKNLEYSANPSRCVQILWRATPKIMEVENGYFASFGFHTILLYVVIFLLKPQGAQPQELHRLWNRPMLLETMAGDYIC